MAGNTGIGGIGGKLQLRMACRLAKDFDDPLIFTDHRRQFGGISASELSLPGGGKRGRGGTASLDIRGDRGIADIGIKIGQIPGGATVGHGSLLHNPRDVSTAPQAVFRHFPDMGSHPICRKRKISLIPGPARDQMPRLTPM